MDFQSIQSRLQRVFTSLNERFDEDISKHTRIEEWPDGKGVSITFDNSNPHLVYNRIMTILHNLASLKDHLKNNFLKNNLDPGIVEREIDGSLHLQILIDLVNQEKHGTPLKRPRSGRNPVIDEPRSSFRMGSKKGSPLYPPPDDTPTMFIDAYIMDGDGKLLFYLDELVETCFNKWRLLAEQCDDV